MAAERAITQTLRPASRFYIAMALVIAALLLAGFFRTFFARGVFIEAAPLPGLVVAHGMLGTCWVVAFLAQTLLVARGRVATHRALGYAIGLLGALFVATGALVIAAFEREHGGEPFAFVAVHVYANGAPLALFAILAGAGIAVRRKAASHKRFMLLATVVLLPPALGRLLGIMSLPALGFPLYALFACASALFDWSRDGRVHPVSAWGGATLVAADAATIGLLRLLEG